MLRSQEVREALRDLVHAVRANDSNAAPVWLAWLLNRSASEWLSLDDTARGRGWERGFVVGNSWAERSLRERADLLSEVVVSWHADGHLRERATRRLALRFDRVSATALALRCQDHVPQIRDLALRGLLLEPRIESVDAVIAVILAGGSRTGALAALTAYTDQVMITPGGVEALLSHAQHPDRRVSRWVTAVALDRQLLMPEQILELCRTHIDPLVRRRCTAWLAAESPEILTRLLDARFVDSRVAALQHAPDRELPDARLRSALLDRSSRIRAVAQQRSRSRELDAAAIYRTQLENPASDQLPAALAGIAAVGDVQDVLRVIRLLDHPLASVRAPAAGAAAALGDGDAVVAHVKPLLLDPSAKVIAAAARALIRAGGGVSAATAAWKHPLVASRRGAWRVSRAAGGWNKVVADLEAANDADPVLARNGRTGLRSWLVFGAARTWQQPNPAQQYAIASLLGGSALGKKAAREVAFHAGVPWKAPITTPDRHDSQSALPSPRVRWWRRRRR